MLPKENAPVRKKTLVEPSGWSERSVNFSNFFEKLQTFLLKKHNPLKCKFARFSNSYAWRTGKFAFLCCRDVQFSRLRTIKPYVRIFPDMSGNLVFKSASGRNSKMSLKVRNFFKLSFSPSPTFSRLPPFSNFFQVANILSWSKLVCFKSVCNSFMT